MSANEDLAQNAFSIIIEKIFSYQLPPGAPVSDFSLSKVLGMSRTPVRQAIMMLVNHGLVEKCDTGYRVAEITLESIDDLYDARQCIEVGILRMAMKKGISSQALESIRDLVNQEKLAFQEERHLDALSADLEFHRKLIGLCRNSRLERASYNLYLQMRMLNVFSLAQLYPGTMAAYNAICDAIEKNDVQTACDLLSESIEKGRIQKKKAVEQFGTEGLQGIYRFIASRFEKSQEI